MRQKIRFAALFSAVLLAGCAVPGPEMTSIPARIDYVCHGNKVLPVARNPAISMAAILVDNQEIVLRGGESAAQEKYTDGNYTLYLEGEKALLEKNGIILFGPCISPVPLPTHFRDR
jgi:membrane-bound inhibitor of C-type lysozyme